MYMGGFQMVLEWWLRMLCVTGEVVESFWYWYVENEVESRFFLERRVTQPTYKISILKSINYFAK